MIPTHENRMSSAHYSRMGHQECDRIHIGTLEILERTGVDVHDEKARRFWWPAARRPTASASASPNTW